MKEFFKKIFYDEHNNPSSKRFVGILGGLSLIVFMFTFPSEYSNSSVLIMSLGALGISGLEQIFSKKK